MQALSVRLKALEESYSTSTAEIVPKLQRMVKQQQEWIHQLEVKMKEQQRPRVIAVENNDPADYQNISVQSIDHAGENIAFMEGLTVSQV